MVLYTVHRSGIMNQPSPIMAEPVLTEPSEWMVDPNEPRYCLCNQVCTDGGRSRGKFHMLCVGVLW